MKYRRDAIAVIGTPEFDHPDGRAKTFGSIEHLNQVCVCVRGRVFVCVNTEVAVVILGTGWFGGKCGSVRRDVVVVEAF